MLTILAADEDQKLLLYVDYVCTEKGVVLPWDSIAAIMEPRDASKGEKPMTGEAIKQHLAKLRDHREGQGLKVPPKLDRGARRSIVGKHTPQTPAPTPRKSAGLGVAPVFPKLVNFGRGKAKEAENKTPVKKVSSLLAPVSKSKQIKAERAMKAALLSSGSGATTSRGGKAVGGDKVTTGKRGRPSAAAAAASATAGEDRDDTASSGVARGKQSRHPKRKNYAGMAPDLAAIGIKDEPESDDDLPLSKRHNVGQKLGGRKNAASGLMGDTVQMWQNRNGSSAVGESAAQSPEVEQSIEQAVSVPGNGNGNDHQGNTGVSQAILGELSNHDGLLSSGRNYQEDFQQATVGSVPNRPSFAFDPANYQPHGMHGLVGQQISGESFGALCPQIETGHPSSMDVSIVEYQAYGRRGGAPGQIFVPAHSNNFMGQLGNDFPLTSSPAYDSSATLPGSEFPNLASGNTSTNTSFSNTQVLQDPFSTNNGYFAGLPTMNTPTMGSWGAQPSQTVAETSFDAGYQFPGYPDSQVSSSCVNPNFITPTSGLGLGISQSHSGGNNFDLSMETKGGRAYPHLDQPVTSAFGMAMGSSDLVDPRDPFGEFVNDNYLGQLHGIDG